MRIADGGGRDSASRLIVVDRFYHDPERVRRKISSMEYVKPPKLEGWRTERGYLPRGVVQRLAAVVGAPIVLERPEGNPYDNGTYFMSFSKGARKEVPGIHFDLPLNHYICIVYLTDGIPANCGTSFYRHKPTGLETAPTEGDAARLGIRRRDLLARLAKDSRRHHRWVEVDRVGYRFNRAVIFPARRLHAATGHYGRSLAGGRVYQLFSFRAPGGLS